MPANKASLDALLKDVYESGIEYQLNDETPLLSSFTEGKNYTWDGRQVIVATHVNRNRGALATGERSRQPSPGSQQIENFYIPMRYIHGAIEVTYQLMASSRSNTGAFANGFELEMDRLMDDLRSLRNFYIWGTGTGVRALADGNPGTGTTFTVDASMGVAHDDNGARFLNEGDHIVAVNPATGLLRAGGTREITAINSTGTTVTVGAALDAAWADNDRIMKAYGADTAIAIGNTEYNRAPMGMLGMVDNGANVANYFGLSRTTFPIFQSHVISTVGAISADIIQRGIDVSMQRGLGKVSEFWCHPSVHRAYINASKNDRRYTGSALMNPDIGTKAATGGYSGLDFGGIPFKLDHNAPYDTLFGCDMRSARHYPQASKWVDEDGDVLSRVGTARVDSFEAVYRVYEQFCLTKPQQSFRLDNISSTVAAVHVI